MPDTRTTLADLDAAARTTSPRTSKRASTRSTSTISTSTSCAAPRTGDSAGLDAVVRLATAIWAVVGAINVVVWLLVGIIGGSFGQPWFLWWLLGGGAVVGVARLLRRTGFRRVA